MGAADLVERIANEVRDEQAVEGDLSLGEVLGNPADNDGATRRFISQAVAAGILRAPSMFPSAAAEGLRRNA